LPHSGAESAAGGLPSCPATGRKPGHLQVYGARLIHPGVLRELAMELAKLLSIICQQSWPTGKVLGDWTIASVTPIYKKG